MELNAPSNTNFNGGKESNTSRKRKATRKEILDKKKAVSELIKAAYAEKNHLDSFPSSLRHFDQNGLPVFLESGRGDKLSSSLKRHLQKILKDNMERHYGHEWATEEKVKRREMVSPEARYIFAYVASHTHGVSDNEMMLDKGSNLPVGFLHFRFTLEEEMPVLYVYEIQLESRVQGRGLGKFLMHLIEIIALKNCMSAVIMTVQKANIVAMDFYTSKLRYAISSISPSRVDPLIGVEKNYEILCKAFDNEAKAILENRVLELQAQIESSVDESQLDYEAMEGERKRRMNASGSHARNYCRSTPDASSFVAHTEYDAHLTAPDDAQGLPLTRQQITDIVKKTVMQMLPIIKDYMRDHIIPALKDDVRLMVNSHPVKTDMAAVDPSVHRAADASATSAADLTITPNGHRSSPQQ